MMPKPQKFARASLLELSLFALEFPATSILIYYLAVPKAGGAETPRGISYIN